jgi:hypothetical protein
MTPEMVHVRSLDQLAQDPIFVVGAARSGTTWVYDILTAHPEVAGVYESWLFTKDKGFGALFTPAHWPQHQSGLGRLLEREELLAHVRDAAARIMAHALKPGHRFLVEKSPSHLFAMPLVSEIFPGARFIHVLRDGRDVCISVRAAARSWMRAWEKSFGRSTWTSAKSWRDAVNRAARDGTKLGEHFLEIRYEAIHADPFSAYRQLFDFCSIPYDESLLQTIFEKTDFRRNYSPDEAGPRRGGRMGDWRTHFGLIGAVVFNLAAGNTLVKLGYERTRFWLPRLSKRPRLSI